MKIQIEVSARHIHLSQDDFKLLFGNKELSIRNNLSQHGEFAANETVEVVGPDGRFKKVRIVGPFREKSQLEISKTDAFYLGVNAPISLSGSGKGTGIKIVGPKGSFMKKIAMVAERHLHLSTKSAHKLKVQDGSKVSALIDSARKTVFKDIVVRVEDNFVDRLHLDTDEANASNASSQDFALISKD